MIATPSGCAWRREDTRVRLTALNISATLCSALLLCRCGFGDEASLRATIQRLEIEAAAAQRQNRQQQQEATELRKQLALSRAAMAGQAERTARVIEFDLYGHLYLFQPGDRGYGVLPPGYAELQGYLTEVRRRNENNRDIKVIVFAVTKAHDAVTAILKQSLQQGKGSAHALENGIIGIEVSTDRLPESQRLLLQRASAAAPVTALVVITVPPVADRTPDGWTEAHIVNVRS
jgi:hypothetical protein